MSQLSDKFCTSPRGLLAVSAGLLAALLATPSEAQITNWSLGDAGGSWSVAGNWDNGIPNSDTADARFLGTDLTALQTITLTESVVVNALRFTDTATPHYRLEIRPTSSETFTFAGTDPVIESGSYSGGDAALRIFAPVVVGSGGLTKIGSGSAAFMNTITGSGTLTFSGGTTEMRGDSTNFTGDIVINSGAVVQARAFGGTGANVLGDTAHATTINGTGQFSTRDSSDKTISEPFVLNGIRDTGSLRCYAGTNITFDGPITLNSDSSFAVADWTSGTVGSLRQFFINSVIADGSATTHSAYFLTDLSSGSYRGTEGRKSEIILGGQSTYGGYTYLTTNYADDGSGTYSGNLRLGTSNALPVGTTLVLGGADSTAGGTLGTGAGSGKFALSGYSQELAGLITSGTGALNRVVGNSTTLSTLTLNIAAGTTNAYDGYLGWTDENDNNLALVKTGDGTLTLGADNTYAGGSTVSDGVLQTTSAGALGSGDISVASGAQLQLDTVGTYTITNALTLNGGGAPGGDGAVTSKVAGADVTLAGAITLTGSTAIKTRGGSGTRITLAGGVDGSAGNYGLALYSDGGRMVLSDNPVDLGSGALGGGFDLNVDGNVASQLYAQWNQTVKLGVDNPFTTPLAVALGNNSGANGYFGKLDLNGHTFTAASLAEVNTNTLGTSQLMDSTGGGEFILDNASGATSTFTGKIVGDLALTKQGEGTLVLSGQNTYTGVTTVSEGTLTITAESALGSSDAGSGTVVASGAVLKVEGGITVAEPIAISGSGVSWSGALYNASGNNTWSGLITTSGYTRIGVANGTVFTLSGGVTGSNAIFGSSTGTIRIVDNPINVGSNGMSVLNSSTVEVNVGNNTWGGTTIEYGGTLKLGLDDALPTTTVVKIGSTGGTNGTLDLNGHSQAIAGLYDLGTGSRRVINSGTAATLSVNNTNDYEFAGVLGVSGQDSFNLTKQGSATLTLSGSNAYTGVTSVEGGTLALSHTSSNNISTSSLVRVDASATLDVTGLAGSEIVLAAGQTLGGNGTVQGAVGVSNGATLAAGASIGALTVAGDLSLDDGATWTWEFLQAGTAGTDYDSVAGTDLILPETGTVNLGIVGVDGYSIEAGDSFTLFEGDVYQGSTLLDLGTDVTDLFTISDNIGWWGTWEVTTGSLILTAVPEPSALLLLAGLMGMLLLRRR